MEHDHDDDSGDYDMPEDLAMVPMPAPPGVDGEAMLEITIASEQGTMGPMRFDATDAEIKRWAVEALQAGTVHGITRPIVNVDLSNYVIDRFRAVPATDGQPALGNRLSGRPKVPFGKCGNFAARHCAHR